MKVRAHVVISGLVQGVFFRAETRREADKQKVTGWIRNRLDGRVEAVLEGDEAAVKAVIAFCQHGPPQAYVTKLTVTWETYRGTFIDFKIRPHTRDIE
jgi:acylphosphatase